MTSPRQPSVHTGVARTTNGSARRRATAPGGMTHPSAHREGIRHARHRNRHAQHRPDDPTPDDPTPDDPTPDDPTPGDPTPGDPAHDDPTRSSTTPGATDDAQTGPRMTGPAETAPTTATDDTTDTAQAVRPEQPSRRPSGIGARTPPRSTWSPQPGTPDTPTPPTPPLRPTKPTPPGRRSGRRPSRRTTGSGRRCASTPAPPPPPWPTRPGWPAPPSPSFSRPGARTAAPPPLRAQQHAPGGDGRRPRPNGHPPAKPTPTRPPRSTPRTPPLTTPGTPTVPPGTRRGRPATAALPRVRPPGATAPPPCGHPQLTAGTTNRSGTKRLAAGALQGMVQDYLSEHPRRTRPHRDRTRVGTFLGRDRQRAQTPRRRRLGRAGQRPTPALPPRRTPRRGCRRLTAVPSAGGPPPRRPLRGAPSTPQGGLGPPNRVHPRAATFIP